MITRRNAFTAAMALAAESATLLAANPQKMSNKDLHTLIERAKTSADHRKLADYYSALANEYQIESKEHTAMAEAYAKNPTIQEMKNPGGAATAGHCRFFASKYKEMSETARTMSTMHADMAKAAK